MKNSIISLFLVGILFSATFSLVTMNHMDDQDHGCPFMGMDTICPMGILGHIIALQDMFAGIPARNILLAIMLVLVIIYLAVPNNAIPPDKLNLFVKENFQLPNFNRVLLALSDGIIQPKLYA